MSIHSGTYQQLLEELNARRAQLVAVSKLQSVSDIKAMYDLGQRDFGENYVQELLEKQQLLPHDIQWHFIGHLQKNKVKYIAPFIFLVHGIDSIELLRELNKQALKRGKTINCLLQVHIASEETKFGLDETELDQVFHVLENEQGAWEGVFIKGLMGMASFSDNEEQVRSEFRKLKLLYDKYASLNIQGVHFSILSMGMSGDFRLALEEGSTMVRIGSLLFGSRPQR